MSKTIESKIDRAAGAGERIDRRRSRLQFALQVKVCERAEREIEGFRENVQRSSMLMDLASVPELDLQKLLTAPKFDFAHDICGIRRHMDRSTYPGKLTDQNGGRTMTTTERKTAGHQWKYSWSNPFKFVEYRMIVGVKVLKVAHRNRNGSGWKRPHYLIGDVSFPTLKRAREYATSCSPIYSRAKSWETV